jgi:hypothetical protein
MSKILIEATEHGLTIPSEYNKAKVKQMVKDGTKLFELTPRIRASKKQTGYLEGAVVYAWAKYQYGLDPRDPATHDKARNLFKQDFWYEVIKDRDGNPKKTLKSLAGSHRQALDAYMEVAPENGYPIPNEKLYLKWRDEYSMEPRWSNFYDWLDYLGIEEDAMPSDELLNSKLQ